MLFRSAPAGLAVNLVEELRVLEPFLRHLADGVGLDVVYPVSSAWIHMDPTELRQVLTNLVSNACDATENDGIITIRLYTKRPDAGPQQPTGMWWCLDVTDSGHGMPADVLARVFEPYFTTKGETGTGIGLTTVSEIVARYGGTIAATSEPGRGSTFTVGFPAALVTTMSPARR